MTDHIPLGWLFAALVTLLGLSGFFAMSETCLMAVNRYRLKHLIREGSRGAALAGDLLARTDELLAFILAGNTVINAATTILVAEICRRLFGDGDYVLAIATASASFVILVFAEILPKIIGAAFSERIAIGASYILTPLIKFTRPLMWIINVIVRLLLKLMRIRRVDAHGTQHLSMEELRTLVLEGGKFIPAKHQSIFLNLFELEDMTVDDTMTPRSQIEHIDLTDGIEDIHNALATAHHTRLVACEGGLDNVVGILHVRKVMNAMRRDQPLDIADLRSVLREPYFVPEGTPLLDQLTNFQENQRHVALVVDEYGEILGLVTLKDILEEIVGEFTSQAIGSAALFHREPDGSVIADGACSLRVLNRKAGFNFPLDGPKTVNGILLEQLEDIPDPGVTVQVADHRIEILQVQNRMVKVVRIVPAAEPLAEAEAEAA